VGLWGALGLGRGYLCMGIRREEDVVETRNICKQHEVLDALLNTFRHQLSLDGPDVRYSRGIFREPGLRNWVRDIRALDFTTQT